MDITLRSIDAAVSRLNRLRACCAPSSAIDLVSSSRRLVNSAETVHGYESGTPGDSPISADRLIREPWRCVFLRRGFRL
jgi:hypothetical protein